MAPGWLMEALGALRELWEVRSLISLNVFITLDFRSVICDVFLTLWSSEVSVHNVLLTLCIADMSFYDVFFVCGASLVSFYDVLCT